ncbi:hypothetical protein EV13_2093 [Prochlorococcus sp. MIT 0702]|nr:hypothetical protein EV13_2093 [Prochlorococcus sp. MIT 0702]
MIIRAPSLQTGQLLWPLVQSGSAQQTAELCPRINDRCSLVTSR